MKPKRKTSQPKPDEEALADELVDKIRDVMRVYHRAGLHWEDCRWAAHEASEKAKATP